ncbi:RAMP superfamily CRISPR-associated protein [Armatimonas sp.]|uniref:RAMP superfamily CRISPR-associated protein n=1 Tax=Armatimonas sp. TaxID=1872638 RepID=UPI0037508A8B
MSAEKRRKILARWVVTAQLTLTSASQIGTEDSESADSTFARDAKGQVVLPGTTLAGALRSALEDQLVGYRTKDSGGAGKLFGDMKYHESPLMVFDAVAAPKSVAATIRDGVRIKPQSRLAADGLKYDRELALPGLTFPIRLELAVPEGEVWAKEEALLTQLCLALEALAGGHIRFGARKSRGLGECRVSAWKAKRYPLTTLDEWRAYAKTDHENPLGSVAAQPTLRAALGEHYPNLANQPDKRQALRLEFDCSLPGTLLIRTPGVRATDPDMVHLTEQGKQLLSGTSLAGALRSHCGRIAKTMGWNDTLVPSLFGTAPEESKNGLTASRVQVSEATLLESEARKQTRVKIDRFTGGALDTALFDQQVATRGQVQFTVELRAPEKPSQMGLLLLAARDLVEGLLPLGGESSIGRGVLKGRVTAHFPDGGAPLTLAHGTPLDAATITRLDNYLIQENGK